VQTIFNKKSLGFLLCVLWALSAAAWAKPRVSVHPLMTEQGPRGERWNALFMREVSKQNIEMTAEGEVEGFLEAHQGSCKNETRCLRDLGYATRAHYILVASMLRTENLYTLRARVMMVNGEEVKRVPLDMERVSKISEEANAMAVYAKLFEELKLESLPPHPAGVSLEPPIKEEVKVLVPVHHDREIVRMPDGTLKPRDEVEELLSQGMSPTRQASYVFMGVSGATVLAGTVFALLAHSNSRYYKREYSAGPPSYNLRADVDVATSEKLKKQIRWQQATSIISFSVATAAAATGVTLFFISPERGKNRLKAGLVPTQGGAVLSLQGVFP